MPPKRSAVAAIIARTASSSATSTWNAKAVPSGHSPTVSSAGPNATSATHTRAPSPVNTTAASPPPDLLSVRVGSPGRPGGKRHRRTVFRPPEAGRLGAELEARAGLHLLRRLLV